MNNDSIVTWYSKSYEGSSPILKITQENINPPSPELTSQSNPLTLKLNSYLY